MDMKKLLCRAGMIVLSLVVAMIFSAPYVLFREELRACAAVGYAGLFLSCLLANASLFLPASSTMMVVAAATTLEPWLCVLVGGLGTAVGEQASYLCGLAGSRAVQCSAAWAQRIRGWLQGHAFITVFLFALIPLPLFDFAGVAAGAMRMNWLKFTLAASLGKVLKFALVVGFTFWFVPWYVVRYPEQGGDILQQILVRMGVNLLP